ncbi:MULTISPECIES: glycosyltransferase family 4 protein [Methylobacterium]|uniref:glycosyltransferase family 4 protein n=1 Tax=Methylobacterium TaxID=407 RepID=UPI0009ECBBAB|nr:MULTISPECIES: glycosyltransferase family 4 protein [Methylobacterium]MCI9879216.1 glycosyltransferase family 4 protein [Methylobacterium goesingense]
MQLQGKRVLIVVENLPVPFDRRVWQEARALNEAGAVVSIISPMGKGYEAPYECIEGVHVYRHHLPSDAENALGYLREYGVALFHESRLAWKILFKHGFDVIHACNPPDLIFLVALQFKVLGKAFIFDHHDINPELYEAKFGRRGFFWRLMILFERLTFACANVSIATNESYKQIAIERGRMAPDRVFIVRSGPDLRRLQVLPPNAALRRGRQHMVGYLGVMGDQEGIDLLLEAAAHMIFTMGREDVLFCLVGGGSSLKALQDQARRMGLEDYVVFTGRIPDQDLFEIISTSDVCVNPDRVNTMNDKSTMNKIIEYMALAKPIVQFDVTEGRRSAEGSSLYAKSNDPIDFAQKIVSLLDDPDKRAAMGEIGRERVVNSLSWHHQVPKLIQAYCQACGIAVPSANSEVSSEGAFRSPSMMAGRGTDR